MTQPSTPCTGYTQPHDVPSHNRGDRQGQSPERLGAQPSDWVPNADILNDPAYLHILDCIESELITQGSHSPRRAPAKMPMSFRTVIDRTQSFVESRCEKSGIKLDGGYTTKF